MKKTETPTIYNIERKDLKMCNCIENLETKAEQTLTDQGAESFALVLPILWRKEVREEND